MDWGRNNVLAVALGSALYLWNAENQEVKKLLEVQGDNDYPTSVAWSEKATTLAIGCMKSKLQIWDPETSKCVSFLCFALDLKKNVLEFEFLMVKSLFLQLTDQKLGRSSEQDSSHCLEWPYSNNRKPRQIHY